MTPLALANEITKALYPELYGKPGNSLQQTAALIGCRGIIDETIRRVLNVGAGQDLTAEEAMRQVRRALNVDPERDLKDAERYRWHCAQNPSGLCATAWRVKAACAFGTPDEATDAAMAALPEEKGA